MVSQFWLQDINSYNLNLNVILMLFTNNFQELQKQLGPNVVIDKKQVAGILTAQWNELPFERKQVKQYYDLIIFSYMSYHNV